MAEEQQIDLGYIRIAGKFWGPESGVPTIALHGFLDNANSFDMLAPRVASLRIFAMDFAGHGWSEHRRDGEIYSGLNDIHDVLGVADALGWTSFNILGHSMGAEVGSQLAGLFPERIRSLICIDGYCGTNTPEEIMKHLRSTVEASFRNSNLKVFPSIEAMVDRLCVATGQNETSARCLIERGHKPVDGGYTWRTDPRIRGSGPFELSNDELGVLLDQTRAPTLFIVADLQNAWLRRTLDVLETRDDPNRRIVHLPGHHHLHMQDECPAVASLINDFIGESAAA